MFKTHHTIALIIGLSLSSFQVCAENELHQASELRLAFAQAKQATLSDSTIQSLGNNPLLPWLKAINLKQGIATATQQQVLETIGNQSKDPAYQWLIGQWRTELIKRQDWQGVTNWQALYPSDSLATRCAVLLANTDAVPNEKWQQAVLAIWTSEVELPKHCIQLIDTLNQMQAISATQNWQRFDALVASNQTDALATLANRFTGTDKVLVDQYIGFIKQAQMPAAWPNTARTQNVLTLGLKALAKRDANQADQLFNQIVNSYSLSVEQRANIQSEIALWSMVNYQANAEARFFAVPESQRSANLREWYMRLLFAQNDDAKTLAGFAQLLPEQRNEDRWQYFQARILERLNKPEQAMPLYQKASLTSSYYGWLAADRRQSDYALCPLHVTLDHAGQKALKNNLSLQRAFMLWQLNEANYAIWEWNAAYKVLPDEQKPKAIELAQQMGWYDRAVFSLENNPVNQRYYTLRFATPYLTQFDQAAAKFDLNRSWLMAHARAESIFMPDVQSSANARGLLQLIPSTAEAIAVKNSIPWQGAESLYQPDVNILLGAGALRNEFDSYPGKVYQAIGAYNAGPTPVNRWQSQRPNLDADFWIETVTYKETRDYIARVLAFSVIYDWRLKQPIIPISNRMTGNFNANSKQKFSCPTPQAKK